MNNQIRPGDRVTFNITLVPGAKPFGLKGAPMTGTGTVTRVDAKGNIVVTPDIPISAGGTIDFSTLKVVS